MLQRGNGRGSLQSLGKDYNGKNRYRGSYFLGGRMSRRAKLGSDSVTQTDQVETGAHPLGVSDPGRRAERIIYIPVTNVFPDPDQPRTPLLPFGAEFGFVRERFIAGEIDK